MSKIHLSECDPQDHPDWIETTAFEAWNTYDAQQCELTEYMADELYAEERVWVQSTD